ncbi:MAG TPA: Flp family type IVb pilin [Chloroflexota bacterium]|nr:Flp family type IVb pilin [Chloroflexota bacterium]
MSAGKEVLTGTELLLRAFHEERAANATEYALVISLIALAIVVAVAGVGGQLGLAYNSLSSRIGTALANL